MERGRLVTGQEAPGHPVEQLILADGTRQPARLVEILTDGNLVTRAGDSNQTGETQTWKTEDILRYGSPQRLIPLDTLVLSNGSLLAGVVTVIGPDEVRFESRIFDQSKLPTAALRGIIFRQTRDPVAHRKMLDQILNQTRTETTAVLLNDDLVRGTLMGSDEPETLTLSIQDFNQSLPFDRITHLMLPGAGRETGDDSANSGRIGLDEGTCLVFDKLQITESGITVQLNDKVSLSAPQMIREKSYLDRVRYYQPAHPEFRFLSSTAPLKVVDAAGRWFQQTNRNRSSTGGPLLWQSRAYQWGLGTHSDSQIIYAVEPTDRVFRATVALDDSSHRLGRATCRVLLLGQDNQWKSASPLLDVQRGQSPVLEIDVTGTRAIGLVTSAGPHGPTGDRVNWLDARFGR